MEGELRSLATVAILLVDGAKGELNILAAAKIDEERTAAIEQIRKSLDALNEAARTAIEKADAGNARS